MLGDPMGNTETSRAPPAPGTAEYGRLETRNIDTVTFGEQVFDTWYGNSAYFQSLGDDKLGIEQDTLGGRRRGILPANPGLWLANLYVCDACFKYTSSHEQMTVHTQVCPLQRRFPPIGTLVYCDKKLPLLIKKVRGFRHPLFCQNLALFGKLFLDDKSVFYTVEAFDFYVVYGHGPRAKIGPNPHLNFLKPMGFFSKEANAYEPDNNLACICIFPPFQRLGLGSLLLEFLYALAQVTPGQQYLGPEFPLSPYGKSLYLRFWARRLAFILLNEIGTRTHVTLQFLAELTGFRREDVLMALEHMGVLQSDATIPTDVTLLVNNVLRWCKENHIDGQVLGAMLDPQCLII